MINFLYNSVSFIGAVTCMLAPIVIVVLDKVK